MKSMSPEVSDLLKRALALPADERAALANTLLDSLEAPSQSVEEEWDNEVTRRMGPEGREGRDRPLGATSSRAVGYGE